MCASGLGMVLEYTRFVIKHKGRLLLAMRKRGLERVLGTLAFNRKSPGISTGEVTGWEALLERL